MLYVLDARRDLDFEHWRQALCRLPAGLRDLHYDPEYARIYAGSGRAFAAFYEHNDWVYVIEPFVTQSAGTEVGYSPRPPPGIASPYGFGGPLSNCPTVEIAHSYRGSLDGWMRACGIQRQWCRLHPFMVDYQAKLMSEPVQREKLVVYMDLRDDPQSELRKGHKSSFMLSRKSKVTVEESDDVQLFYEMYKAMLDRNDADDKWRFDLSLLYELKEAYPDGFHVLIASVAGRPEAGCVLLGAYGTCYYHYAGGFDRHRGIGVGQALVVGAAELAKRRGYSRLHLGGGLTTDPEDKLLRFKSGFSLCRAWCYTYTRELEAVAA